MVLAEPQSFHTGNSIVDPPWGSHHQARTANCRTPAKHRAPSWGKWRSLTVCCFPCDSQIEPLPASRDVSRPANGNRQGKVVMTHCRRVAASGRRLNFPILDWRRAETITPTGLSRSYPLPAPASAPPNYPLPATPSTRFQKADAPCVVTSKYIFLTLPPSF